jgi:hypothetical protein
MKRAGRIHWLVLVGVLGLLAIAFILVFSKESPSIAANRFMYALAKGDVKTLTELSFHPNADKESIRKQWEFATKEAGPYYRFTWKIRHGKEAGDGTAAVVMDVVRDVFAASAYDEKFELPMVMHEGRWMVDVPAISRNLYPALPR